MYKTISGKVISLLIIFVLWHISSLLFNKDFFPNTIDTFKALIVLLNEGEIYKHILSSAYRIISGTLLGTLAALPLGLILGWSRKADAYLGNIFNMLYPIPKVVFLPIIIVVMGIGDSPKIFLISLVVFFQLTLTIRDAVRHIPNSIIQSMKALRPSFFQNLIHMILPACILELLTALRGTIGVSTALLFITENFASFTGLGYFITKSMDSRNFCDMYAGILMLALLGVGIYFVLMLLEWKLCPWKRSESISK
jgi:NitT/TauT family transport system permease protein